MKKILGLLALIAVVVSSNAQYEHGVMHAAGAIPSSDARDVADVSDHVAIPEGPMLEDDMAQSYTLEAVEADEGTSIDLNDDTATFVRLTPTDQAIDGVSADAALAEDGGVDRLYVAARGYPGRPCLWRFDIGTNPFANTTMFECTDQTYKTCKEVGVFTADQHGKVTTHNFQFSPKKIYYLKFYSERIPGQPKTAIIDTFGFGIKKGVRCRY